MPAGVVFIYLHHALQKHLSHRYVVLQPSGRKIHLIDVVLFLLETAGRYQCPVPQHVWQQHYILVCESTSGPRPMPRSHCCTNVTGILLPSGWNLWITEHELWNDIAVNVTCFVVRFYFWLSFSGNAGHWEGKCVPVKPLPACWVHVYCAF